MIDIQFSDDKIQVLERERYTYPPLAFRKKWKYYI